MSVSTNSMNTMSVSVTKAFNFQAAHRLQNHEGKCRRIHGHDWKVALEFEQKKGGITDLKSGQPNSGMVVDFGDIKEVIKIIVDTFDHLLILDITDPLIHVFSGRDVSRICPNTLALIEGPPTSEVMAIRIFEIVDSWLQETCRNNFLSIVRVTVGETCTSEATYQSIVRGVWYHHEE